MGLIAIYKFWEEKKKSIWEHQKQIEKHLNNPGHKDADMEWSRREVKATSSCVHNAIAAF